MTIKDCNPVRGHPVSDPESLLAWLVYLQRRQNIDDQIELTSLAVGDEFWVLDISETAPFKLKKITAANVIVLASVAAAAAAAALYQPLIPAWSTFTPARTGWTDVGSPTVTGRKYQIGNVAYMQVKVVPGVTCATVAGTSFIDLPIAAGASGITGDGSMLNSTTLIGVGNCAFDIANSRIYVPAQAATANTLVIGAWWEVG